MPACLDVCCMHPTSPGIQHSVGACAHPLAQASATLCQLTPPQTHTHTHSLSLLQAFLDSLTTAGRWAAAAARLPGLLREDVPAWERWLYTFAQVGCAHGMGWEGRQAGREGRGGEGGVWQGEGGGQTERWWGCVGAHTARVCHSLHRGFGVITVVTTSQCVTAV